MEEKMYNLEQIDELSGGNVEFIEKMVNLFIELTPELLNRIKVGLTNNNYDEIKAAAHKMKPSIDMMGIDSLKGEIRNIERMAIDRTDIGTMNTTISYLDNTLNRVLDQLRQR